jgi:hypothetical protein
MSSDEHQRGIKKAKNVPFYEESMIKLHLNNKIRAGTAAQMVEYLPTKRVPEIKPQYCQKKKKKKRQKLN